MVSPYQLHCVGAVADERDELVRELAELSDDDTDELDERALLELEDEWVTVSSAKSFCQFNSHAKGEFQLIVISLVAKAPISSFQQLAGLAVQPPGAPSGEPTKLRALGPPEIISFHIRADCAAIAAKLRVAAVVGGVSLRS